MLDRVELGKKEIENLVSAGAITSCHARIFFDDDDKTVIGFVMLDFRGNGLNLGVRKQRGGQRLFSSIEAAYRFGISLGFDNVIFHRSSLISAVDDYLADRAG
ncbi:MAG: hypothetical protein P1U47_13025 [Zhongshania sp.]|uniref:hypothetical protein n=1 Tax=Zhongshania sp. TaxID=1971902 RepID=UPI00261B8A4A|nr:hypothetical protein [Zhongshania sp.]MDF1693285.1 hypothetical protein [Zhongshania sp.]MDF1693296.1 hypothetical protein [Zhongshania sp.]